MDRNTITGLVLIFAILIGYSIWMTPSSEEREAAKHRQDSIFEVQRIQDSIAFANQKEKFVRDSIINAQEKQIEEVEAKASPEIISESEKDKLGVFASSSVGTDSTYYLENDLFQIGISSKGAKVVYVRLKKYQTYDSLPLVLFDVDKTKFGLTFFANNRIINTDDLYFKPEVFNSFAVSGDNTKSFAFRLYALESDSASTSNSYIEYVYTLKGNNYMLDFDINFIGLSKYIDKGTNYIDLAWSTELKQLEKSRDRFNGPTIYYKFQDDDVNYLSEQKDDEDELVNRVKWVSFTHRFFSSTLIAKDFFLNANIKAFELENQHPHYLRSMQTEIGIPFQVTDDQNIPLSFYFGPNRYKTLRSYDLDLERQIPLGWSFFLMAWINRYAVIPVFNFLEGFGWNYGIIILILTILLKIVLFPIAYKSYTSSAKMRALKPEIEGIGKKFPKKEDAMKKQQATMALYKQAGVNPMAGCIPMLLQFPILIAMFRFFPSAIELRQQSFLWATDLSSYDSIWDLGFNIPFYGDHVSLFTLLMTISTLIYTKMNQDMMGSTQQQMPGMKTMMYLMPIMFLGLFNNYAAGLSYYYFLANVFTFSQMFVIRKTIDESKIRAKIEMNKKKPAKKKSSWQKRLEDAAKQRGYNAPKKK
ncbi:MAG: membrane protein insertase YidC [Bacteroidales bacterium]|nr:membrane protein insertase YidC [Bacteroidales bacterium]MCF8404748.1 membrane protein insertase YidC [Bacteroidales bacterium]